MAFVAALMASPDLSAKPRPLEDSSRRAGGEHAAGGVIVSGRLPLLAPGGELDGGEDDEGDSLVRTFRLGAPGVWFIWLKATNPGPVPALLTWDLDGNQPLKSARAQIQVQPHARSQWVSGSRFPGFRAQVHVLKGGDYSLRITLLQGKVTLEKVALTLYFSAKPAGETLDHSGDPGGGRASFPEGDLSIDGFRDGWPSPRPAALRSFYLDDEKGDDRAAGTSPSSAWRTLEKVNGCTFRPGDAILLKRGGKWEGGLHPQGEGAAGNPITIGAWGEGDRPEIDGIHEDAVRLEGQSHWTVQGLSLRSDPTYERAGLQVRSLEGRPQPRGISVFNVVAYDNGGPGIHVGAEGDESNGYDGVLIENCLSFCNAGDGIEVNGGDQDGCRNTVIRRCTAYSNHSMAGIWIHSGQNGLIERCVAYNNRCVNIWAWNAVNVTIRRCEAFRGHESDASGFDIDYGTQASTIEYCYSHHNEGDGYLLMGSGEKTYRGFPMQSRYNILRYSISEDEGEPLSMVETFQHGKVYNNLFIMTGAKGTPMGVGGWPFDPDPERNGGGGWPSDTEVANNISLARNGDVPLSVDDFATKQGNTFDYNIYWRPGRGPFILWGGRENGPDYWEGNGHLGTIPPKRYGDISKFRRDTGQEAHGSFVDPRLAAPGRGGYGRLPLPAHRLVAGSPAIGAGKVVELDKAWLEGRAKYLAETGAASMGIPMQPAPVTEDYWGNPVDPAKGISIGPGEP